MKETCALWKRETKKVKYKSEADEAAEEGSVTGDDASFVLNKSEVKDRWEGSEHRKDSHKEKKAQLDEKKEN